MMEEELKKRLEEAERARDEALRQLADARKIIRVLKWGVYAQQRGDRWVAVLSMEDPYEDVADAWDHVTEGDYGDGYAITTRDRRGWDSDDDALLGAANLLDEALREMGLRNE